LHGGFLTGVPVLPVMAASTGRNEAWVGLSDHMAMIERKDRQKISGGPSFVCSSQHVRRMSKRLPKWLETAFFNGNG